VLTAEDRIAEARRTQSAGQFDAIRTAAYKAKETLESARSTIRGIADGR
jgi:hypothetical protein